MAQRLSAVIDTTLARAKRNHQRRWPRLFWPRAIIVRPANVIPRFGALIWMNMLFVDGRLEEAPSDVVSAIVAHEYGHVALGHAAVAIAVVASAGLLVASSHVTSLLLLAALPMAAGLVWLHRPARELEADAFAAAVVGRDALVSALTWIAATTGKGWTPLMVRRRQQLLSAA